MTWCALVGAVAALTVVLGTDRTALMVGVVLFAVWVPVGARLTQVQSQDLRTTLVLLYVGSLLAVVVGLGVVMEWIDTGQLAIQPPSPRVLVLLGAFGLAGVWTYVGARLTQVQSKTLRTLLVLLYVGSLVAVAGGLRVVMEWADMMP